MRTRAHSLSIGLAGLAAMALALAAGPAAAHIERPIDSPIRPGPVPDEGRSHAHVISVCKRAPFTRLPSRWAWGGWTRRTIRGAARRRCDFEHIQDAVNAAPDDTLIQIYPGLYREEPSRAAPTSEVGDLPDGSFSYEYQLAHPNDANLIAILGKRNITLEGMGASPRAVVIDAGFEKDVGIRCDRCEGIIVRNLTVRNAGEHGIYFVDTDGYVFDRTIGEYANEYQLFAFASDNGLFHDCEALGGSDSGIYVGGSPDTSELGRFSAEIRNCWMHHNALGFSGTQGNSVWMHHNEVFDNAVGISFNSQNDHPNFPQRQSLIEENHIHDNNFDIYAPGSDVPPGGPADDFFHYPVGTGMWIIGGEDNVIRNNRVHDNGAFGFILAGNALEAPLPAEVHRNEFSGNLMGTAAGDGAGPNGTALEPTDVYPPGGTDFFWDGTGNDNCWGENGASTTFPEALPGPCPASNEGAEVPTGPALDLLLACLIGEDGSTQGDCPSGTENRAPRYNRNQRHLLLVGEGSGRIGSSY